MKNKYISGTVLSESHTLNVDKLTEIVSDLKWQYFTTYHQEPKYIKIPIWVYVLLEQFSRQIIGFSERIEPEKMIPMYMGLQICDTISINEIEDIEVF